MISINSRYGFNPKRPAIRYKKSDNSPFTCFTISEKITGTGAPSRSYQSYNMIVWGEAIEIDPSDKVFIEEIDSIGSGWYMNAPQITVSCKIRVVKTEECPYIPSEDFTDTGTTAGADDGFFTAKDDDTALPFEL